MKKKFKKKVKRAKKEKEITKGRFEKSMKRLIENACKRK